MSGNIDLRESEKLSVAYKTYAKGALMTQSQINLQIIKNIIKILFVPFALWALIEFFVFKAEVQRFMFIIFLWIVVGAALGGVVLLFMYGSVYKSVGKLVKIERSEGYGPRFYEEMEKTKVSSYLMGDYYNLNGYADKALEKLGGIDPNIFVEKPSDAHLYYSALITALSLKGDRESAVRAYNSGLYYLKTYMNSPIYGDRISLSLAIYEYCGGNYETAARLTDNALRLVMASSKKKNRIPDEYFKSAALYWKAMCRASMGNKAAAREIIYSSREHYATDYYRKCFAKLLEDMANDDNRKNEVKNETIS